ncbi:hypothetical protein B5X24_HaOG209645 [Helicoverpa armigera]|uniref:Uncharacterized protein n=1 Tax=Helicoverpa armigera TaxID=29058 RepID=A0A2W1BEY9_HELAM|nr:hypothetical protein B5X24_HaOG209645 [Helicoverpa armigera]
MVNSTDTKRDASAPSGGVSERSEALSGRLSKSASELSCAPAAAASPPRARSAHHHAPLSVVHRTQHFFTNLKALVGLPVYQTFNYFYSGCQRASKLEDKSACNGTDHDVNA